MDGEYQALVTKVSQFTQALHARLSRDMVCRAGCDGCCQVWLAPSAVEADAVRHGLAQLPLAQRAIIAERGRRELEREARHETQARCAMLEHDGRCAIYESRPLVCRTQGHALRYPDGVIPEAAVRKRLQGGGEVSACVLNFTDEMPSAVDTIDAERIDQLLALVNARYCATRGLDPLSRHPLSAIAAESDVLACTETDDDLASSRFARDRDDDSR